ncbi:Transcription factor WhiB [Lentzea xinjiangensis]|uniref:Transcription factor WhiB n=1 Tax=Lentzea xinjiangensis TaxID=402600 RepID=A0A1H9TEI0_9PSEU|nr:WhiB family transcriptional regulator [Lentzea xinjiangensis]SER95516.1 Transcription factor WhiB [Lentzea xinjiangensis]
MTTVELPRVPWSVPDWHERGACQLFPELDWIEAKAKSPQALACKTICAACPVRYDCAISALERGEPNGIWGGLDRADRKKIAVEFGFPLPGDPPPHGTHARRVKWGCTCRPCKDGHALYERERRFRARAMAVWSRPLLVLTVPFKAGRRLAGAGQYLLPLDVPAPLGAEREQQPDEAAIPAAA